MYEEKGEFEVIMGMSKADKMLENLGYEKVLQDSTDKNYGTIAIWEIWRKEEIDNPSKIVTIITFSSICERVDIEMLIRSGRKTVLCEMPYLSFAEIHAINEKCKELRGS